MMYNFTIIKQGENMKTLFVATRFGGGYREYTYKTTDANIKAGSLLVTEYGDTVHFLDYVNEPDFPCKWVIGSEK